MNQSSAAAHLRVLMLEHSVCCVGVDPHLGMLQCNFQSHVMLHDNMCCRGSRTVPKPVYVRQHRICLFDFDYLRPNCLLELCKYSGKKTTDHGFGSICIYYISRICIRLCFGSSLFWKFIYVYVWVIHICE